MRCSLIATGGALLAAAAVFGSAGAATADIWTDWTHHYPSNCGFGVNEDTTYHHVTPHGVYAGTRDADGCKNSHGHGGWGHDHGGWGHQDDHWKHRNWPTSGNGNWIGHGYGPGAGAGVGH
ncbi:hypothetical protein ACFOY2_28580 [Nonomuraea purpurea]|uniref:Uncharacterized protein n=1 Tax=Nonomuraea purpurea TaxID=1849276 RepID=A0ABV8GEF6_9ACTN